MREYIVYRHGYDGANQTPDRGLPSKMPVLRVEAGSAEEACALAARQVPVSDGQRLSAEPAEVEDTREDNRNLRAEAL